MRRFLSSALALSFVVGFALLGILGSIASPTYAASIDHVTLIPYVMDTVRVPGPVPAHVVIHNGGVERIEVDRVALRAHGREILRVEVQQALAPDLEYSELAALVERLPIEYTERHRPRDFADPMAREFVDSEIPAAWQEIAAKLSNIRHRVSETGRLPFLEIPLTIPMDTLFAGSRVDEPLHLEFEVHYQRAGEPRARTTEITVRRLPPFRGAPESLYAELGSGLEIHAGDLHVHSCHGEALGACSPSANCTAETAQLSGSFSFAELRAQYEALGLDWFTATDHSYCINSDSEYDAIADEVAAITDGLFIALPDTEVSSDESGPQVGSDLGDVLCFGLTSASHMGAHGIDSRIFGGDDALLGFCDGLFSDALESFHHNIDEIRAEGGYPIVHHPDASSWGWNSFEDAKGIEENALHGVEVWNGGGISGQGGNVSSWVDWLLAGRILYAYSGSDTHDEAIDFGANRVLMTSPFTPENLEAALMDGRTFISNEHFLVITARAGTRTLRMGDRQPLPVDLPPGTELELRTHYDVGDDSVAVTLYRGVVGDGSETVVCTGTVTGSGILSCTDEVSTDASSYYRSYSEETSGDRVAYTNPIFLLR